MLHTELLCSVRSKQEDKRLYKLVIVIMPAFVQTNLIFLAVFPDTHIKYF